MKVVSSPFPGELQHLVFEIAARRDQATALNLVLVAKHVRAWIDPILYQTIIIRSAASATRLLSTLRASSSSSADATPKHTIIPPKPRSFFQTHVKHLAIASDTITIQQAKTILSFCSHRITAFAVWGTHRNPSIFLPFIKSPRVTSLSLKSQHDSELTIPPAILSQLTHLAILDGPYTWFHLRQAAHQVRATAEGTDASTSLFLSSTDQNHTVEPPNSAAPQLFQSLTHFAVCSQNWGSAHPLLKVAKNLRYFAIVVPPGSASSNAKMVANIQTRIREMEDKRVVLVEYERSVQSWEGEARSGGRGGGLWERVERLVDDAGVERLEEGEE